MTDLARLTTSLADRYRIDREIGRGGMATVYRARDAKHDRQVAIKVLDPELGAVLGAERFLAEIKVTANLQHPNLLPLFDSGEAAGLLFYVMPFVEGESLRARLDREKQLPVDEAIRIAIAVAGALDYAHRHEVIHRDLKPENILLHDGQPLLADFGIALAVSNAGGARITQTGLSLGTPQYMSPEQATGERAVDARTDIYSLGAVTYEMLTGEPPHVGTTAQAIIAKLMTEEVRPTTVLRRAVPPHVDAAVRHALEKLAADRFATANDFALALQRKGDTSELGRYGPAIVASGAGPGQPRVRAREFVAWMLAAVATAGVAWALLRPPRVPDAPVVRTTLELPPGERVYGGLAGTLAVSPQGDRIAYVTTGVAGSHSVIRRTSELVGREMAAGGLVSSLAFSPDGRWLAYVEGNEIKKTSVDGGAGITLGSAPNVAVRSLSWAASDTIVVGSGNGLFAMPAGGGTLRPLFGTDSAANIMASPVVLPDGKTVFFVAGATFDALSLAIGSLASRQITLLAIPGFTPLGMRDGHLLYVTNSGVLMALPFDLATLRPTGDPVQVEDSIRTIVGGYGSIASLSASGTLAYVRGQSASQLVMASANRADAPLIAESHRYNAPRFSPDGRKVAVAISADASSDIWVYDLAAHTFTRLTTEGSNGVPEWSPDGTRIVFRSDREGRKRAIWWQPADGSAKAELLYEPDELVNEAILSPDAHWLVYRTAPSAPHSRVIFGVPLTGDRRPVILVSGSASRQMPRFSPDGKWLTYVTNESGRYEVYVRPFPDAGSRVQVSNQGGTEPIWSRSGRALFYRTPAGIVSVAVTTGASFSIGDRRAVITSEYLTDPTHANYDVSPDGSQFLMLKQAGADSRTIVVHNWGRELREKLAAGKK